MRTHYCGALRSEHVGQQVELCGWVSRRREHGEHLAFVDLRDHTGVIQCVVDGSVDVRSEYVLRIVGTVRARPEGTTNDALDTGAVEVGGCQVTVLAEAEPPPFPITDRTDVDETVRLRHRYVDLRRPKMQRSLRVRAAVNSAVRTAMEEQGFIEVETPMLIASTPEGARDFVVPSRMSPGNFYALPQSPQLFKQLLMVGGTDRYYQLARCLRDEDLRADRQFEFMQLDAEASFVSQDDVREFISFAVLRAARAVRPDAIDAASVASPAAASAAIDSITWHDAIDRYGVDKPDLRFGMELIELTEVFAATEFKAFQAPAIKGLCVRGEGAMTRSRLDALTDKAKRLGAAGLVWMRVGEEATLDSPVRKFLSDAEASALVERTGAQAGDLLLLVAAAWKTACSVLGSLRLELGRPAMTEGGLRFVWVTDFPLFEALDDSGRPIPAHHPFTMPHVDDIALLESDPLAVRSQAYDLVLNGWELGSGSIRIHRLDLQRQVLGLLGIDARTADERFGFLLDAFRFGAPPHGGFAFGLDRLVALLAGEENIREVIAFPKTQSGTDPLTKAPTAIDASQLAELGLRILPRS